MVHALIVDLRFMNVSVPPKKITGNPSVQGRDVCVSVSDVQRAVILGIATIVRH